jgi:hypothetical protein
MANAKGVQTEVGSTNSKTRATADRPITIYEMPNCHNTVLGFSGSAGNPITFHDSPSQKARHFGSREKRDTSPVVIDLTGEDELDITAPKATKTVSPNAVIAVAPVAPMAPNPGPPAVRKQDAFVCLPAPPPPFPTSETPQGVRNPLGAAMRPVSNRPMKSEFFGPPSPEIPGVSSRSSSPPYSPPPAFPEELSVSPVAVLTSIAPSSGSQASSVAPHQKWDFYDKGMAVAENIL